MDGGRSHSAPLLSRSAPSLARSAPSLPLAYNLRQCSKDRRRIEHTRAAVRISHPLGEIDLVGGNGRWRQKRAKEQWILDQAEAEKQRREQQILEDEKRRRLEEREARRRKQQEEDQQRQRALEEQARKERLELEERERQEEEERRLKALQDHEDWLARQPKTCTTCMGSGKCTQCGGKGFFFAMFLSPSVGLHATTGDFGRAQQGCPECGGCAQNIRGDLVQGSGHCHKCDGVGMVTPEVVEHRVSVVRNGGGSPSGRTPTGSARITSGAPRGAPWRRAASPGPARSARRAGAAARATASPGPEGSRWSRARRRERSRPSSVLISIRVEILGGAKTGRILPKRSAWGFRVDLWDQGRAPPPELAELPGGGAGSAARGPSPASSPTPIRETRTGLQPFIMGIYTGLCSLASAPGNEGFPPAQRPRSGAGRGRRRPSSASEGAGATDVDGLVGRGASAARLAGPVLSPVSSSTCSSSSCSLHMESLPLVCPPPFHGLFRGPLS
ncbi:unnamed protein product [Prorocentrum cordatum]|uniref:Uncharacterized protein n=1 Tax=Prorocentrum cordatum TaxID=2364126 RepID=A0ABN9X9P6_9DINO|nr:unnamed protein product [Polarella glacialis]